MSTENKESSKDPLESYTETERDLIEANRQRMNALSNFIGKEFDVPVELNEPGNGWSGDPERTVLKADPNDLLHNTVDELRHDVAVQAGRLRVSRLSQIPKELWNTPGYQFLTNKIEAARATGFVTEAYPKTAENITEAETAALAFERFSTMMAKQKLGFVPKFLEAGHELSKQWYSEISGTTQEETEVSPEVAEAMKNMRTAASDAWWQYPSKEEADTSEELVQEYARQSRDSVDNKIWPEFQRLVDQDLQDAQMQEMLKDLMNESQSGQMEESDLPQQLSGNLSDQEMQELLDQLNESGSQRSGNTDSPPSDLDSMSDELKDKLRKYLDSLPQKQKDELRKKALQELMGYEEQINNEIESKLNETPNSTFSQSDKKGEKGGQLSRREGGEADTQGDNGMGGAPDKSQKERDRERNNRRKKLQELFGVDKNVYEKVRTEMLPVINWLEDELREIFSKRRESNLEAGFNSGKHLNVAKLIQEEALEVSAFQSKAWERNELPLEYDYAFTLLVDVTTSMLESGKMMETFKGVVVITEVFNRLSINLEVLAYNTELFEFQRFGQKMSDDIRQDMGDMLEIPIKTQAEGRWGTATAWSLKEASERLRTQIEAIKVLICLTDGRPDLPPGHPKRKFDLRKEIAKVKKDTTIHTIGGGIGPGTGFVAEYFEDSFVVDRVSNMGKALAAQVLKVITNYR